MTNAGTISRDKLANDMKIVIAETEELLKATAGHAGEKVQGVRARIEEALAAAKSQLGDAEEATIEGVKAGVKATNTYVHDNPWPAIAIAAGVGVLAGWILGRK